MLLGIRGQNIERGYADVAIVFPGGGSYAKSAEATARAKFQHFPRFKCLDKTGEQQASFKIRFSEFSILLAQTGQVADAKNALFTLGIQSGIQGKPGRIQNLLFWCFHFSDN
jgi:hypothetical protein